MSINIGQAATDAVLALRGNEHFMTVLTNLHRVASAKLNEALFSTPDQRVDATAYARGISDVWIALEVAYTGQHVSQVQRPRLSRPKAPPAAPTEEPQA